MSKKKIEPQSGCAFELKKGEYLKIIDPKGGQVSDVLLFNKDDVGEKLSAGKTMDFEESILLTTGNRLWSNRGNVMADIFQDSCGRHDILLAPCSQKTFEIMYGHEGEHANCFSNFCQALEPYGIQPDDIPTAFNVFMNVRFEQDGKLSVLPPLSKPGDSLTLFAWMDLVVGMTACSAEDSNGGSFKPIQYEVTEEFNVFA